MQEANTHVACIQSCILLVAYKGGALLPQAWEKKLAKIKSERERDAAETISGQNSVDAYRDATSVW